MKYSISPGPGRRTRVGVIWIAAVCWMFSGCSGCAKSGRIHQRMADAGRDTVSRNSLRDSGASLSTDNRATVPTRDETGKPTTVKMEKKNGVYQIPVTINGSQMYFIFDTGAGMISISTVEATFLYKQGKLTDDDVMGKADFLDANGNVSQDVIIKLKEVTIGNRTIHDIQASVVANAKAPLLFGQSALERFGKISIDYGKGEISFE